MARPIEEGLDYFPLDVDFYDDPKIIFIEEQFGVKGGYIANRLLCWIFRNGYFLNWDDDMALVFAKRVGNGVTHTLVNDVVCALLKRDFFNKKVFDSCHILTSRGIQKRWIKIIQDSKRKAVINSSFDIVSTGTNAPKTEETIPETEETTQSKVKESKGNKKKVKIAKCPHKKSVKVRIGKSPPPPVARPPSHNGPPLEDVARFFRGAGGTEEMAKAFWNKWESSGWMDGLRKITNWSAAANGFIATWHRNETLKPYGRQTHQQSKQPRGVVITGNKDYGKL